MQKLTLLCLFFLASVGCRMSQESASDPALAHVLSDGQVVAAEERAGNGDKDAAFALAQHYGAGGRDEARWLHWLDVAVRLGHPVAMANKAAYLAQSGTPEACGRAKALYARAIDVAADEDQRAAFSDALSWIDNEGSPCAGR